MQIHHIFQQILAYPRLSKIWSKKKCSHQKPQEESAVKNTNQQGDTKDYLRYKRKYFYNVYSKIYSKNYANSPIIVIIE